MFQQRELRLYQVLWDDPVHPTLPIWQQISAGRRSQQAF